MRERRGALSFAAGDVAEIHGRRDDDVARSRKLTDLGLLTQEITKSTARNDWGKNVDIRPSDWAEILTTCSSHLYG